MNCVRDPDYFANVYSPQTCAAPGNVQCMRRNAIDGARPFGRRLFKKKTIKLTAAHQQHIHCADECRLLYAGKRAPTSQYTRL
jgi:hypothetical protein